MNVKTILAANFATLIFLVFTGYCLYIDKTGFAGCSLFMAALCATTFSSKKDESDKNRVKSVDQFEGARRSKFQERLDSYMKEQQDKKLRS